MPSPSSLYTNLYGGGSAPLASSGPTPPTPPTPPTIADMDYWSYADQSFMTWDAAGWLASWAHYQTDSGVGAWATLPPPDIQPVWVPEGGPNNAPYLIGKAGSPRTVTAIPVGPPTVQASADCAFWFVCRIGGYSNNGELIIANRNLTLGFYSVFASGEPILTTGFPKYRFGTLAPFPLNSWEFLAYNGDSSSPQLWHRGAWHSPTASYTGSLLRSTAILWDDIVPFDADFAEIAAALAAKSSATFVGTDMPKLVGSGGWIESRYGAAILA